MGLLDIFKKKNKSNFENENHLETILRKAATDAAYRPEFYKRLISEKLVVITSKNNLPNGSRTLEKGANVNIFTLQDGKIPIFTSTRKIFENGIINEEVPFLEMQGADLFNLTKGATFILNPYSEFGKELLPNEIEGMLNGTILSDCINKIVIEKETQVKIGQPAIYPTDIINSLKTLFSSKPSVNKAYLGWIYNPSSGEPPHYIFALDIDGESQNITNEAGSTIQKYLNPDDIIDFVQMNDKGGLCDYFLKETKPFYER